MSENVPSSLSHFVENFEPIGEQTIHVSNSADSASYRQQYDRRGYPENPGSRALIRQSRRAQNDVLETVGVCINAEVVDAADKSHGFGPNMRLDRGKLRAVIRENTVGLSLSAIELPLVVLTSISLVGLKCRLSVSQSSSITK